MTSNSRPIPHSSSQVSLVNTVWTIRSIVLLLSFFAFFSSLAVSRQVFEAVPHLEDEVAYLFQAKIFARGQAVAPLEFPQSAYWQPFVIDHETGVRFGKYPPAWPMALAGGVLLGLPAFVNAALAALTVAITYRLGRDTFNRETGLMAAALIAFSPMALLLNGTLMAHTAALCWATLFMWAYLRMTCTRGGASLRWAAVSGASLGLLVATRPLSAAAVALPFILWSGIAVLKAASRSRATNLRAVLTPLLVLSFFALLLSALVPLYNAATTGDPRANLYTMVPNWEYDKVGFGPDVGRNGHTLTKGVQFARYDLSLAAADLFGWQLSGWTDMLTAWVNGVAPPGMIEGAYWPVLGISWLLLPFGLIAGFRREWAVVWVIGGALWVLLVGTLRFDGAKFEGIELWALGGVVWACLPLIAASGQRSEASGQRPAASGQEPVDNEREQRANSQELTANSQQPTALWTWLLFGALFCLIAAHTAYWIGAQRYSARYYAEGLSAAAVLAALGLAWLMQRGGAWRWIVPGALVLALAWSYFGYSIPRVSALRGYNRVTREVIDGVLARRDGDRPVLVIVNGVDARWRTRAALWTLGSPFLDGEVETVLAHDERARDSILARLPGRQVIEMGADIHDVWFMDTCDADGCELANPPVNPTLLTPAAAP
jgi:hypothetical protein